MSSFSKGLVILGICIFGPFIRLVHAQLVINEICPSNISIIQNSNGKYDDWIELYNSGSSSLNLSGYGLSDDPLKPYRLTFPNYTLPVGGRTIVFASDVNNNLLVNHWETAVNASTTWRYFVGNSAPDTNWRNPSFNEATWTSGAGGIGLGDADDATTIAVCSSVMMRPAPPAARAA